jgi:6-phosphogluconolactonase
MAPSTLMVVGSLNRETPYFRGAHGPGLSVYAFDETTGTTTLLQETRGVDNPTFLSVTPDGRHIYANSEVFGWAEGLVSAFRMTPSPPRLRPINAQPAMGSITAHNSFDATGRFLLVANYAMGVAEDEGPGQAVVVFPLRPDGGLAPAVSSAPHTGRGPNAVRQERAHAHCVRVSPDNRFAIVADLGLDALFAYPFDAGTGRLGQPRRTDVTPGSGPRHFLFHPNGALALIVGELDSTVTSLRYDAASGGFATLDRVSVIPVGATGNHCADIQLHANSRVCYVSNRGHDSVAQVGVDPESGRLTMLGTTPCGGPCPRNLALDPSGRILAVANQNGDNIAFFAVDGETGALRQARDPLAIGTPMCIKFARI